MEYDTVRRYPHGSNLVMTQLYNHDLNDRDLALSSNRATRPNPRSCPIGGPVGGHRGHDRGREGHTAENGLPRRRIAIACARCRKRKIRCSGDHGSGEICFNCRQAGVGADICQFHRVGSNEAVRVLDSIQAVHSLQRIVNPGSLMPAYNAAAGPVYFRPMSATQYSQPDTKSIFSSPWTIPYAEDTSSVETYNPGQPAAYPPNQSAMIPNPYGGPRWSPYSTHVPPYVQTNIKATTTSEVLSPLNMSSLQVTLPERPRLREVSDTSAPQRHLPVPQPAHTSRNGADQFQDKRIRATKVIHDTSMTAGSACRKPVLLWTVDGDAQVPSVDSSSGDLAAQGPASGTMPNVTDGVMGYPSVTTSVNDEVSTSNAPQLNFTTSTLLDAMTAPVKTSTTYSNFRGYRLPTSSSSSADAYAPSVRPSSQSNLYKFGIDDRAKRAPMDDNANDSALVSGHQYTPLSHSQPQHTASLEDVQRESLEVRDVSLHGVSLSKVDGPF